MKNSMIAVAILAAAMLVLASAQAAENPKRTGTAATSQGGAAGVQPGGRTTKTKATAKHRSGKTGKGMDPQEPCCSAPRPGLR